MTSKTPKMPPAARPPADKQSDAEARSPERAETDAKRGRSANLRQNTRNQGYQQDR